MKLKTKTSFVLENEINIVHAWFLGIRPKTLTAGSIPILIGTLLAWVVHGKIDWIIAFLTFFCAVLIQIGINLINDVLDFKKGADNELRIGFRRVTQSGLLSPKAVLKAGFFCFAIALLCGIPLTFQGGGPFLFVLLTSIIFGYLYTGGPFPLAYHGLGDIFAFVFFGVLSTLTAYYLQIGSVDFRPLLAGIQIGFLATTIIAINNFRDIACDAKVNKRTLAVLFGSTFARVEITFTSLAPFFLGFLWVKIGYPFAMMLPCLVLPLAFANIKAIWFFDPSPLYNQIFIRSTFIHLFFGILLALGYVL